MYEIGYTTQNVCMRNEKNPPHGHMLVPTESEGRKTQQWTKGNFHRPSLGGSHPLPCETETDEAIHETVIPLCVRSDATIKSWETDQSHTEGHDESDTTPS